MSSVLYKQCNPLQQCTPMRSKLQSNERGFSGYVKELTDAMTLTTAVRAQADMEEAHAMGAAQAGVAVSAAERSATGCASCLEEAWHWGFELDCWRAHLGPLTWPEVLRQWAIAAGMLVTLSRFGWVSDAAARCW